MLTSSENRTIANLVPRAVSLAFGVAVVELNILGAVDASTSISLLGIGLFALAVDALDRGRS